MKETRKNLKHITLELIEMYGGYVRRTPVDVIDGKQQ
jgi:hypothetical protein